MTTELTTGKKTSFFKDFFIKKKACPVCEGKGTVECCNAEGKHCVAVPCSHCEGKGYTKECDVVHIVIAVAAAAVCAVAAFLILS